MRVLSCLWFLTISAFILFLLEHPRAQMPGDTVGWTQYEYQSNSACGNRIAVDGAGTIHVTWMKGTNNNTQRHVYFNCKTSIGWLVIGTGMQVSEATGAGYPCLDILPDNRAAIFYHRAPTNNESLFVAVDAASCQGFFDYYVPPNRLTSTHRYIWPNAAIDNSSRMHLVATWNNPNSGGWRDFMYARSNNGGTTWTSIQVVDTLKTMSPIAVASPVSDKVAIVYSHPVDITSQMKNDIYYIMSNDGTTWDFVNGKINVSGYGQGDSLFAFADLDAVFDYDDRLHIIWVSSRIVGDNTPIGPVYLYHYVDDPGTIVEVTHYNQDDTCDAGPWNYVINKKSLAASPSGGIYTVYTRLDCADTSASGEANGELYAQASFDGGLTWGLPTNITNTPSPGCVQPDCRSEIYPSMAEKADDYLHIFYVGYRGYGAPQHLMLYYAFPTALLGATEPAEVPRNFTLYQNYPNPFNAATTIGFDLTRAGQVRLEVFDITGAKVATLLDERKTAGHYEVIWDASGQTSGIYFARLECEGLFRSVKLILLK